MELSPPAALSATLVATVIGLGALVTLAGHLAGVRRIVAGGIAILLAGSALMIAGAYLAWREDPSDPRPCAEAGTCE